MAKTPKKHLFSRFSLAWSRAFSTSFFVRSLSLYRVANERLKTGVFHKIPEFFAAKKAHFLRFKTAAARLFENSFFVSLFRRASESLLTVRTGSVGIFFFVFGIVNLFIYLSRRFLPLFGTESSEEILFGLFLMLASLPMLSKKRTIARACSESRLIGKFLSGVVFLRPSQYPKSAPHTANALALLLGLLAGAASFFINPFLVLLFILLPIPVALSVYKPEFGMFAVFFFLPFLSSRAASALTLFVLFCLVLKLLRGKRTLHTDLLGIVVLLFTVFLAVVLLISGKQDLSLLTGVLCYFIVANLSRQKKVFENLFSSFLAGAGLLSTLHILFFYLPESAKGGALRAFEALLLKNASLPLTVAAAVLCIYPVLREKRAARRLLALFCLLILLFDLWLYTSLGATLATAVSIILLLAVSSRAMFFILLLLGGAVIVALPFLEGQQTAFLIRALSERTPALFFVESDLPSGAFFTGIGAFSSEELAQLGCTGAAAEHLSFYTAFLLGLGLFGLLTFFFILLFSFQKSTEYYVSAPYNHARLLPVTPVFAVLSLLLLGFEQNFLPDARVFSLLFSLVAISSATTDILSREDSAMVDRF